MRRARWLISLTSVLVLVLAGTALAAKPPTDPPTEPVVTIDALEFTCLADGHLKAEVTVSAGPDTRLENVSIATFEVRSVPAGVGGYSPFDQMLTVSQWSEGIDSGSEEARGKPTPGLPNPTVFSLNTADGSGHHWNTVLTDGNPAPDSWFEVHANALATSTARNGGAVAASRVDHVNCFTGELMQDTINPWEDWNFPAEG